MTRLRERWLSLLLPLVLGITTPAIIVFVLQAGPGGRSAADAARDVVERLCVPGNDLFNLLGVTLLPFVALDFILLTRPPYYTPGRVACLGLFGVLGILALLVPTHWEVWSGAYVSGHVVSTAVLAPALAPFFCVVTMLAGVVVGAVVWRLGAFGSAKQRDPASAAAELGQPRG